MAPLMTIRVSGWIIALYNTVLLSTAPTSSSDSSLSSDVLVPVLDDIPVLFQNIVYQSKTYCGMPQSFKTSGGVQYSISVPPHDVLMRPIGRPPRPSCIIRP